MADIESNINLDIDASGALASLKELQRQISVFQTTMAKTGSISNARLSEMQRNLVNNINSTGQFTASIQRVKTTTESFTQALEKNKLSMGQYFRYSLGATKTFGKGFRTEFDTIEKVARERVKTLQTQYIKLGRDASGAMQAIAVRPQVLDMKDLGTQTAIAAQKAQLFNQLMQQGSTNLLNFGKNTQWAGRQLMVGFTIPLGIMGAAAAKEFQAIEEQVLRLQRVYGDFTTTMADTEQITQQIKDLGGEFTKYGVAVSKTIGLAADAAAMGKTGADLVAQVAEANRLAVLGGVDQAQSLETTISLTNAFGVAADQLSGKINFLNAVENQTVTSIEDLTEAIPKAGPVVQQLGGNVEDLTFFLTAMKEGGINASEGANALKSGLASLINPTGEAVDMLASFGINLQGIVEANKGNVRGIVVDFAKALDTLDPLNRAQAIEQLFGKFQFSRLSTLFQNVIAEGSQASRVLDLTKASAAELASLSERELGRIEASPLFKYQAAIENFKAAIAPLGEEFMKAVTPLINFGTQILEAFNGWSDGAKQFAVIAVGAIGAIGPVLLMTFGLLANGLANIVKGVLFVRNGFKGLGSQSNVLTEQLGYMNTEQLQAAAVSASLNQVHNSLIQTFTAEAGTVRNLASAYGAAVAQQNALMGPILTSGGGTRRTGKAPKKYADGIKMVPGYGNKDSHPAMLMPGEAVIPKKMVARYGPLISAMVDGKIPGYADGTKGAAPKKYNVSSAGIKMSLPEHLESLYGKSAAEAELARATAAATETERALLAMRERGIKVTDQQIKSATQLDRSHVIEVTNEQKKDKRAWGEGAWSVQTGGENNLILGSLAKSSKNREIYFEYLKKTGATEKQIAEIQSKITRGVALTEKELQVQGRALRAIGADWESGTIKKGAMSGTFGMYAQAVGAGQLAREQVLATQTPAQRKSSQRSAAQIKAAQDSLNANVEQTKETKKKTKVIKQETAQAEERVKDPRRVAAGLKAAETRRANAAAALAAEQEAQVKQTRMQRLRGAMSPGKLGMAGMVAGSALSAASMMGGPVGDIAGQVGGPLMAISGVASVLGMIPGPAGLAVAALAAVAAGGMALKQAFDDGVNKAIEYNSAIGAGTKAIESLATASGRTTASQQMDQQRQQAIAKLNEQKVKDVTFGQSYLESDAGSAITKSIEEQVKNGQSLVNLRDQIVQQMSTAVVSGALDPEQARSIVAALGEKLQDPTFALGVNAKLLSLLGPNGENIAESGITVSLKIAQEGQKTLNQTITASLAQVKAAENNINIFEAFNQQGQAYGTIVAQGAVQLQQQQALVDALDLEYQKKLEIANASGDSAKASELTTQHEKDKLKLLQEQKKTIDAVVKPYTDAKYAMKQAQMGQAMDAQIKKTYENDPTMAALAQSAQDKIVAAGGLDQTQEYQMKFLLSTGDIPPQTFISLMDTFGSDQGVMTATLNMVSNLGTAEGGQMIQVMNSFVNEDGTPKEDVQRNFIAMFENKNQEEQLKLSEFINTITAIGGDMELFVQMSVTNPQQFEKVQNDVALIEAEAAKGPMVLETILSQMTSIDEAGIKALTANQDWFNSLPPSQQKVYLTRYITTHEEVTPAQAVQYLKQQGIAQQNLGSTSFREMGMNRSGKKAQANYGYTAQQIADATAAIAAANAKQYVIDTAPQVTSTAPPPGSYGGSGGGGGGGTDAQKPPTSFLDSVIKDIRDFANAAQGLTEDFESSMGAIRAASVSAFGGLSQQLRGLGLGEDVISLMTGMSKEEWDQYKGQFFNFDANGRVTSFKTDLGLIAHRLQAITLGKFVDEQQKSLTNLGAQNTALTKLVGLGMTYANAYKLIEDAALAAAIANAKSAEEIRQIIALAEQARKAQSVADASKSVANANATTDATVAGLDALIRFNSALTDTQTAAILADSDLQTMLANFDTLTVDQLQVLNEALQDAANKEALEIKIKMQTKEGMQEIFNEGFNKAMEQFTAKEQQIKIKFKALKDPFQDVIDSFSNQIEDMKNMPGGLDDLEADLQRIGEQEVEINKKYDERYKALDSISKINERVAAQQRTQLSLAEALSQGDIAAAARAAEEMRANDAAQALVDQREALQKSQQLEIENLTANMGMTREQLEGRIRDIKRQIFEIEEQQIEPAQRQVELLTRQEELQISALTVAGKTKEEWETIKNNIDVARTNSEAFKEAVNQALIVAQDLEKAWKEIEKPKQTIHTIIEKRIAEAQAATPAPAAPAPAPVASTAPAPAPAYNPANDPAWVNARAIEVIRGQYGNGQARKNALGANYDVIQARVNAHYAGNRLFAKGGYVASYMANGGLSKPMFAPKGTDTVPAMLTPGEFVVKKWAVDRFGVGNLQAINQGNFGSGSVYNYNMSVNVRSDANPDEIARTVMAQIKRVDAQRIRGNRF
jgi:TP901 family phage tail tape measure protein